MLARAGRLDALVNNAGYVVHGAVEETSVEEARAQFDTNVFGVMRMVRLALPLMRRQRSGVIVNMSSLSGLVPGPPFCGVYSASKHVLEAYTASAARGEVVQLGRDTALVSRLHKLLPEPLFERGLKKIFTSRTCPSLVAKTKITRSEPVIRTGSQP